jgi:hypothetical protein
MKCLIVRCHESKAVFAHAIPVKGADEDHYVADLIASDVAFMGHIRLLLKSDNEPALLALAEAALQRIRCQVQKDQLDIETISTEQAATYESASNGETECGIRAVRGLFHAHKLQLERRIEREVPPTHPLSAWLLEHVCLLINALHVGEDGKTPWKRLRGRDFGQRLVAFGERVRFKQPPKGPQHDVARNMGPRMFPGTFIGYHLSSNSYRVINNNGDVIKTRGIMRRPLADGWNAETIENISATPWSLRQAAPAERVELGRRVAASEGAEDAPVPLPRRLKITMQVLDTYGTTEDCPQCTHIRAFSETKPGVAHSEKCRQRIVDAMEASDSGAAKLAEAEQRMDRAIAQRVEAADDDAQTARQRLSPDAPGVAEYDTEFMELLRQDQPRPERLGQEAEAEVEQSDTNMGEFTINDLKKVSFKMENFRSPNIASHL